jgi:Tfp pilus assembly protein PilO
MTPTRKIYLSIAVFGTTSILLIIFIIFPLLKEIKKNSEAFLLEREKVASLSKEKENLQKIKNLYQTYQSDLEKIEDIFIDSEVPIELVTFLEKTASTSLVQLKILSMTKKTEKEDDWPSLLFQLSVTGSFSNFLKFVEKLENGPYLIEILDLNTHSLTEKETKKLEGFPLTDTDNFLTIKVFTK